MRILIMAAALLATPAAATTEQAFDLVCTGQQKLSPNGHSNPKQLRYRIDLVAKSWCREDCGQVKPIQDVSAGQIVIELHERTNNEDYTVRHIIDRTTGAWTDFYSSAGVKSRLSYSPGAWFDTAGKCEVSTFSGFPARKF